MDSDLRDPTFESLEVTTTSIQALDDAVEDPRGIVIVAGASVDVTVGVHALCNVQTLRKRTVAVLSSSGLVGPTHVLRLGTEDDPGATFSERFQRAVMLGLDAFVLSEIFDLATAHALFEAPTGDRFIAAGLHTGNATGVPTRLLDMGIREDRLRERLNGILAFRLAERPCEGCRRGRPPTEEERAAIERIDAVPETVWEAPGCGACEGSGTRGFVALTEWLSVTSSLRDRLGEDPVSLRDAAFPDGAGSLGADGLRLMDQGLLPVREWMRMAHSFG